MMLVNRVVRRASRRCLSSKPTTTTTTATTPTAPKPITNDTMGDTATTRLFGSDWADRRGQRVSFTMKVYWSIFGLFILNGAVTQMTGRDEFHYYDLVKSTLRDAAFGKPAATEHDMIAAEEGAEAVADEAAPVDVPAPIAPAPPVNAPVVDVVAPVAKPLPASTTSVLSSSGPTPMGMPMGVIPSLQRAAPTVVVAPTVAGVQWQEELDNLRAYEATLRAENARNLRAIAAELQEIAMLKGEIKKRLRSA
ncbi:hypothetical protein SPRG_10084 [Saprolegnia parasitica CBS 223.65]|uniref:Uncharacterized protein n=1 Tax=Saprolegnia parasitica (strain CBS 223.65) TaxID=695850 RepID=A0A067C074_SAPPC|nr:hypothetical protein SPRG_10084 [Saprolegnia parasitica CBS 223.65]KDO23938.1 hypothetical protein SPRG_10084 [Saprolegnia parasitica CBS 223.65]|eukprot:XP_012205402.1 hypothetical protein SPRG_10084 [Saprolegnia parasitica CBS 223.65]